jgi:hypothetical protein
MSFRTMSVRTLVLVLGVALAWGAGSAQAVCTAAQITSQEPSCPAVGIICLISKQYSIDNGCTLDFGGRDVTLQASGVLTIGSRSFTLRARTVTLLGRINGVAIGISAAGGMVTIETSGDLTIGASGTIDVRGNRTGGAIIANVGGAALIAGKLLAKNNTGAAGGGLISVSAAGSISDTAGAAIDAEGGIDSDGGGEIDLVAGGDLTLLSTPSVFGYDGGYIALEAGGKATIGNAKASGRGDAGSGGCVDLLAGAGVEVKGQIDANGVGGLDMTGGCGGLICIDGGLGQTRIAAGAAVNADGASPDGGGGQVALAARGNVIVSGTVTARGPSGETCGGDVCIDAGYDMQLPGTGSLDVSGGDAGGDLEINAGRDLSVSALVDASGRQTGSLGGDITLRAGATGSGSLTVAGTIDVSSRGACNQNDCGQGGFSDLSGCDVTFTGTVLASGPDGGENLVTARDVLGSFGVMDATRTVATGVIGVNRLVHRIDRPPTVNAMSINPAAVLVPVETCPTEGETDPPCLVPCPVCGNGVVEFPETCDLGMMPPKSCSGCSAFCQFENCDDGRVCTADSCDVTFGCVNQPTPECHEPTATMTGTLPTATATPTPSLMPSAIATRSATPTASPSLTAAASQTAAPTATGIDTATPSASNTATETPTPEPTVTAPPACPGDCNGVGGVTVNELILGVNIALGNTGAGVCPAFDGDASGTVSISELIAAVKAALNGC